MASHVFSLLPIFLAYRTNQMYLLYFTIITTIISLIYHFDENAISLHVDEFASCALIVVTFMTYVNDVYSPHMLHSVCADVVLIDYCRFRPSSIFMLDCRLFTMIFVYERRTVKEMLRLKVKDTLLNIHGHYGS